MPITQEQEERFKSSPLPSFINPGARELRDPLYKGVEALVMEVIEANGQHSALKWYASLEGYTHADLVKYAAEIIEDEDDFYSVGLTKDQIPPTQIYIEPLGKQATPQLFSKKEWIPGRPLNEVSLEEMQQNRPLRDSVINLFLLADEFYLKTGRFPDIKEGEALYFFNNTGNNPQTPEVLRRSTNIIVRANVAILPDTKTMRVLPDSPEAIMLGIKQKLIFQTAQMLAML